MAPKAFRTKSQCLSLLHRNLRHLLPLLSSFSLSQASTAPTRIVLLLGLGVSCPCTHTGVFLGYVPLHPASCTQEARRGPLVPESIPGSLLHPLLPAPRLRLPTHLHKAWSRCREGQSRPGHPEHPELDPPGDDDDDNFSHCRGALAELCGLNVQFHSPAQPPRGVGIMVLWYR